MQVSGANRRFLFLQGPHGPYFHRLGRMLTAAGASVWRVGFNRGDRAFWPSASYIPYKGTLADWSDAFATLITDHAITDIVLYGDTRPLHAWTGPTAALRQYETWATTAEPGSLALGTYEAGWAVSEVKLKRLEK